MLFDLEGLSLSRSREMRPMLARVLTDLFAQAPGPHARADIERYATLMDSLYDDLDRETRVDVASRIAQRSDAPGDVIFKLASDAPEVAERIVRSPALGEHMLLRLLERPEPALRAIIAGRAGLGGLCLARLSEDEDRDVISALLANEDISLPEAVGHRLAERLAHDAVLASTLLKRPDVGGLAAAPLFLVADRPGRVKILAALSEAVPAPLVERRDAPWLGPAVAADLGATLVAHARAGRTGEIVSAVADFLALAPELAASILSDDGGEPLVITLKAMRLADDAVLSLILLANPVVGRSVERVYALADLNEGLSADVAQRLVAFWRTGTARPSGRHAPLTEPDRSTREDAASLGPRRREPEAVAEERRA